MIAEMCSAVTETKVTIATKKILLHTCCNRTFLVSLKLHRTDSVYVQEMNSLPSFIPFTLA